MAIIKYTLDNGSIPNYITDGGVFFNPDDNTIIGVGSGGGTVLSKSELLTRVLAVHGNYPRTIADDGGINTGTMSNSEVTAEVNQWCTARSVS